MNESTERLNSSRSVQTTLVTCGLLAAALLATGRKDFPNLHTVLDTGMFLLSGVLASLIWDMRERIRMEHKLAKSNEELERRVLVRTAQLEVTNQSLEAEMKSRRQAEERLRVIVEAAPNAMIMMGEDGRIAMMNAQIEKLFGYPRTELLGQAIEMLVPERLRARHPGLRQGFFASPQARPMGAGRDLHGLCKDG